MQKNLATPWSSTNLFADVHCAHPTSRVPQLTNIWMSGLPRTSGLGNLTMPNLWRKIEPTNKVSPEKNTFFIEFLKS